MVTFKKTEDIIAFYRIGNAGFKNVLAIAHGYIVQARLNF